MCGRLRSAWLQVQVGDASKVLDLCLWLPLSGPVKAILGIRATIATSPVNVFFLGTLKCLGTEKQSLRPNVTWIP